VVFFFGPPFALPLFTGLASRLWRCCRRHLNLCFFLSLSSGPRSRPAGVNRAWARWQSARRPCNGACPRRARAVGSFATGRKRSVPPTPPRSYHRTRRRPGPSRSLGPRAPTITTSFHFSQRQNLYEERGNKSSQDRSGRLFVTPMSPSSFPRLRRAGRSARCGGPGPSGALAHPLSPVVQPGGQFAPRQRLFPW